MISWMSDIGRDARQALRQLARRPGFAAAAILTLILGLGAPTAVFSIVQAVLLRPLPYADADRIVRFRIEAQSPRGRAGFDALDVSVALEWAATSTTLEGIALYNDRAMTLSTNDGPVRLAGLSATPNLFEILATSPLTGAVFSATDRDVRQVVFSHQIWQQHFDGDRGIVGRLVTLDGHPHRVTGIMPAGFDFPSPETAFWVPVVLDSAGSRGMILPAIGRLTPGSTPVAVAAEGQRHLNDQSMSQVVNTLVVRTLHEQMTGNVRGVLWLLMAAVSLVSVIATVNIAMLLLTRGTSRAREFMIRTSLGADRRRLIRQVTVEGLVLATMGGLGGLLFASGAAAVLVHLAPPELPRLHETSFDAGVLGFTALLVVTASIIFGVMSARRVSGTRLTAPAASRQRLNVLAAGEFALATVLLVGAALLIRSFLGLVLVDHGFDPSRRVAMQITLPSARYPSPEARMAFHDQLLESLRSVDVIRHIGLITAMPHRQPTGRFAYDPEGRAMFPDPFAMKLTEVRMTTEGFFDAMGIPLLQGRTFSAADVPGTEPVMVISESMARQHFPDGDALGRMLYSESGDRLVIGIVGDVRSAVVDALQHDPSSYLPIRQDLDVFRQFATMSVVLESESPSTAIAEVRRVVRMLDPDMPLFNVRRLSDEVAGLTAGPRFTATVLGLFAAVALVMATVGVYGVMSYSTAQRTREIGVRVALGATRGQIMHLVLRDGVTVVGAGLLCGLMAAWSTTRVLAGHLPDLEVTGPGSVIVVGLLLSSAGLTAAFIPALRATRVSVLAALRED